VSCTACRAHTKGITCVEVLTVYQRLLLATASELSVRLWTIQGQFLSVFGQPGIWTNLAVLATAPVIVKRRSVVPRELSKQRATTGAPGSPTQASTASANTDVNDVVEDAAARAPVDHAREHRHSTGSVYSRSAINPLMATHCMVLSSDEFHGMIP